LGDKEVCCLGDVYNSGHATFSFLLTVWEVSYYEPFSGISNVGHSSVVSLVSWSVRMSGIEIKLLYLFPFCF
jgi:hypothetical protein